MSDPLDLVRSLAAERRALEVSYRGALQAARDAGLPASRIGEAAGVSRQRVLQMTSAPAKPDEDLVAIVARLEELDARWDLFVDRLASALFVNPDAKREQLRRNTENGKRKRIHARSEKSARRRGFADGGAGLCLVPTVKSEGRRAAEAYALKYIDEHRGDGRLEQVIGELDEAAVLREQVSARSDPVWLHD